MERIERAPISTFRKINYADRPRSGHRVYVDADYLYVLGGYSENDDIPNIHGELWKLHLQKRVWTMQTVNGMTDFASFGCIADASGSFLVYGGTSIPFGFNLDERIHFGLQGKDGLTVKSITPKNEKDAVYGNVFLFDEKRKRYISMGGTLGRYFHMNVHALERTSETDGNSWAWRQLNTSCEQMGRFRMEAVIDGDSIIVFGGGQRRPIPDGLKNLLVYDLVQEKYTEVETLPDPVHGFPPDRKCHGLAQRGRSVSITGGCDGIINGTGNRALKIHKDCWTFNLDTRQWIRRADLNVSVFFHSSAFTEDGRLLVFGGITSNNPRLGTTTRTNITQFAWIEPPSLFTLAQLAIPIRLRSTLGDVSMREPSTFMREASIRLNKSNEQAPQAKKQRSPS